MNTTLSEILSKYYVTDSPFTTHVSMVNPKGTYQFDRNGLEELWEKYGEKIRTTENPVLGIAEKSQNYLPVLVDLDLKIQEDNDIEYEDHLYTEDHVIKVIEIYQSVLRNIVRECTDDHLMCVLLEKPIYRINKGNISYLKNGFHMHFPNIFLSKVDQKIHLIPRVKKLMNEYTVFSDLGIENSGDLIDESYCTVPWLMYGSSKENMEPYKISKIYNSNVEEISLEKAFKHYQLFDKNEQLIKLRGKVQENLHRILSIIPYHRSVSELKPGLPSPLKISKKEKSKKNNVKVSTIEALKISAKLLPMLSNSRAEDRNEWMTIGWILFNIGEGSQEALEQWCEFSSRSEENYDEATCIFEWDRMVKKDLTLGTLRYYASIDNPAMYEEYKKEQAEEHVKESLNGSHNDIAKMLHSEYGNEFVCSSIASRTWFQFMGNNWEEIEDGVFLREHISENIVNKFVKMSQELLGQKLNCQDKAEASMYDSRLKSSQKMIQNLRSAPYKNNVMREAVEVFYDRRFQQKLDTNPYLFPFKNGVYDLKLNIFRAGRPEDFISKCSPIDYIEMDESDDRVIDVYDFLTKVFPDSSVRKYFMDQSSDIFVGGNHQKVVIFWTGEGDNGKSVTQSIFEKMLGPLAIKFSTTLITGKKTNTGAANPELARAGGGVRWAVLEEPDGDEQINIGMLKSLSGNDSYWARDLFEKGKATREMTPLFKLIFICTAGETSVSLASGISVSIEKLRENHRLLSWDSQTDGIIKTSQQAFIDQGKQECVTLTLLDGRKITCTPNHKFLTIENEWVEAQNIKINETKFKMGIDNPKCDDIFEDCGYVLNIGNISYDMKIYSDRLKAMALCKLFGYVLTDGSQNKLMCLGHKIDAENVVDDIELLSGKRPKIRRDERVYSVGLPFEISREFSKVVHVQKGGKVNNEMVMPDFIFEENCPTFLIREFLAGMFGGDGVLPSIVKNQATMVQLVASKVEEHVQSLVDIFTRISVLMFSRFGIESIVTEPKYYENYVTDLSGKNKYNVFLRIAKNDSILSFVEKIGVRYCCHKSYRLMAVGSMLRYKKNIVQQNQNIIERTRELIDKYKRQNLKPIIHQYSKKGVHINSYRSTQEAQKNTGIHHSGIKHAIKRNGNAGGFVWREEKQESEILDEPGCEKIIDAYNQAVRETQLKIGLGNNKDIITYSKIRSYYLNYGNDYNMGVVHISDYLESTKLTQFCNQGKDSHHYSVDFGSENLPYYEMSVVHIENAGMKNVYDINVEEPYSNFIAEGIVTHNCNKLPKMKYSDPATWNRIRVIPFESTFVRPGEPCPETYEEQLRQKRFPMDKEFGKKIPSLVQAFAWVLLEHRKNIGVRTEPEKVRMATAMYRKQNDIYRQFVEESIVEEENSVLSLSELYMHFKEWFREGFPGQQVPVKNEIFEYFERLWGTPLTGKRWRSYRIRTLQDDIESGNVVILDESDLINYDEEEKPKAR